MERNNLPHLHLRELFLLFLYTPIQQALDFVQKYWKKLSLAEIMVHFHFVRTF